MSYHTRISMEEDEVDESASENLTRMEKGSHLFVVKNYSLQKGLCTGVDKAIESEEFMVGGHRWTIRLYPYGKTADAYNVGETSLYISLKSESPTYVKCYYDLYALDQSGKGNHMGFSLFHGRFPVQCLPSGAMTGYVLFMKRASLESPDYLKDDCLKIHCTMGVLTCHIQNLPVIKAPKSNIGMDFGKLLENKLGVDIIFKVENESFCAHKCIFAAHSPVFRSHISKFNHSQEIVIPDMKSRIFKAMLWFIYTGTLLEEEQEAVSYSGQFMLKSFLWRMLAAADRFELKRLKKICESRLLERVSVESVAYLLHLADFYDATELKVACLRFAAENQDAVMESDGCEYLKQSSPSLFLELAGYKEISSTSIQMEFDFCNKMLCAAKKSFVGTFCPWNASYMKSKLKES